MVKGFGYKGTQGGKPPKRNFKSKFRAGGRVSRAGAEVGRGNAVDRLFWPGWGFFHGLRTKGARRRPEALVMMSLRRIPFGPFLAGAAGAPLTALPPQR